MNILKKLILSSILVGFISCSTSKAKCDAYANANKTNSKKTHHQIKT